MGDLMNWGGGIYPAAAPYPPPPACGKMGAVNKFCGVLAALRPPNDQVRANRASGGVKTTGQL